MLHQIQWMPKGSDPQQARLRAALLDAQRRLVALAATRQGGDPLVAACDACLAEADREAAHSPYVAWDCLHQFDEEALQALSSEERDARWCSMLAEAGEKLKSGWRWKAAECLEKQRLAEKGVPLHLLKELHSHLAAAAQNHQHKLALFERRTLSWVAGLLFGATALVLGGSAAILGQGTEESLLPWARAFLVGIPAGAMGGILSMTFSVGATDLRAKVPEMRLSWPITVTRPLLGAAVAIPIVMLLHGQFIRVEGLVGPSALLACCFLGGFSERWFLGVIGRLEVAKT